MSSIKSVGWMVFLKRYYFLKVKLIEDNGNHIYILNNKILYSGFPIGRDVNYLYDRLSSSIGTYLYNNNLLENYDDLSEKRAGALKKLKI